MDVRGTRVDVRGTRVDVRGTRVDVRGTRVDVRGTRVDVRGTRVDVSSYWGLMETAWRGRVSQLSAHVLTAHPWGPWRRCRPPARGRLWRVNKAVEG